LFLIPCEASALFLSMIYPQLRLTSREYGFDGGCGVMNSWPSNDKGRDCGLCTGTAFFASALFRVDSLSFLIWSMCWSLYPVHSTEALQHCPQEGMRKSHLSVLLLFNGPFRATHFEFSCSAPLAGFRRFSVIYHLYVSNFIQQSNPVQCKFYFPVCGRNRIVLSASKPSNRGMFSRLRNICRAYVSGGPRIVSIGGHTIVSPRLTFNSMRYDAKISSVDWCRSSTSTDTRS
jgi:hypothetical protein